MPPRASATSRSARRNTRASSSSRQALRYCAASSGFLRDSRRLSRYDSVLTVGLGIQILLPLSLGGNNVPRLRLLASAAKQNHYQRAFPSVVDPVPRAEI